MKLTLGFSPCPNDTFIFDALVNQRIDTGDLQFEVILEDVETLNEGAMLGRLDITKLSFPAFFSSLDKYILLDAGSALGKGVGPLLISREIKNFNESDITKASIAIPGLHTTANLLLGFAFPGSLNRKPLLFSKIEDAVLNGITDLGVIIHENRFTYAEKGLHKVMDLGEYWERKMGLPLPLGGIAIKKDLNRDIALKVNALIRKSLEYAFSNYPRISPYVREHSQDMREDVMRKHIDLYVNEHSLSLGEDGRQAIRKIFELYSNRASTGIELFLISETGNFSS